MLAVQKYKLIWDELVIQKGSLAAKLNEDILSNFNAEELANLGQGDIFRIGNQSQPKTIEEIIRIGEEKDDKKYKEIKEKVLKDL